MNIWTHLFGFFLVLGLTIKDLVIINIHATALDKIVAAILLSCFLVSLFLIFYFAQQNFAHKSWHLPIQKLMCEDEAGHLKL